MTLNSKKTAAVFFFFLQVVSSSAHAKTLAIIGAGLSGLTTAHEVNKAISKDPVLRAQEVKVQVFEAKDRAGGRIFTVNLNGQPAELGGENLNDGGDAEHMRKLVSEAGLHTQIREVSGTSQYYYDSKTKITYDKRKDLFSSFPDISPDEMRKTLAEAKKHSENLGDVLQLFFNKFQPDSKQDPEKFKRYQLLKESFAKGMLSYEGGDVHHLAARYSEGSFLEMILGLAKDQKPHAYQMESVDGGNSLLIEYLAKELGASLHLGSPLRELKKSIDGNGYELLVGDGEVFHADWVVLAIPCPVFQKIHFHDGTVPTSRLRQIGKVAYGTHAKILVPSADKLPAKSVTTDGLTAWMNPDKTWTTLWFSGAFGIMRNPEEYRRGFEWGKQAVHSLGIAFEDAKGDSKKDPVETPHAVFSSYTRPIGKSWTMDPDIGGSYSYNSAEMSHELEAVAVVDGERVIPLFSPIEGKIFFAGEHTSVDPDLRGSMEGAVESGFRTSRIILGELKRTTAHSLISTRKKSLTNVQKKH